MDTWNRRHGHFRLCALGVAAITLALGLVTGPGAWPAKAEDWWEPGYATCPAGKVVQIEFTVAKAGSRVGVGRTRDEASSANLIPDGGGYDRLNYVEYKSTGRKKLNYGLRSMWWQVWKSAGKTEDWSQKCVAQMP